MNRMVRMSRHARVAAATATVVAGVLAGALASPAVRRRLPRVFAVSPELADAEPTPARRPKPADSDVIPPAPTERTLAASILAPEERRAAEETSADDSARLSRSRRALAFVRRGVTATVLVLLAVGGGTGAYALYLRPDSAVPQPTPSKIDVTFGPGHVASSPIHVELWLRQEKLVFGIPANRVALEIYIGGKEDLTLPGLTLTASVSSGVQLSAAGWPPHSNGPFRPPRVLAHRVTHNGGEDIVTITLGAVRGSDYYAKLTWDNFDSGPMQIREANLVAAFPDVTVGDQTSAGSLVQLPSVILTDELQMGDSDYAYFGGQAPEHESRGVWSWNPASFSDVPTDFYDFSSLKIEARDVIVDEQSHSAEFLSGVFFGVAAAAFIAALQEFVNSAIKRKREADGT